jgi:hypothetical protein
MPLIEAERARLRERRSTHSPIIDRVYICCKSRWSLISMPMLAMMAAILLLGELTPHVPRNFSFVARDADDKEVAV